ncbi:MAG: hypothetical protein WCA44_16155 [Acidobacteriaceae bacterium]
MRRKRVLALALALAFGGALTASAQQTPAAATTAPAAARASANKHVTHRDRSRAQHAFMQGAKEMQRDNPRAAMDDFARAAQLDPADARYSASVAIARQRLVYDLVQQAEKEKLLGHLDEARAKIQEAYRLAPDDPQVAQHVDELAAASAARPSRAPQVSTAVAPPIQLRPQPGRRSFHVRTNEQALINQVFAAWGIHPTIDETVGSSVVPYDLDDVDFAQTEATLALATNTFFVPLDPERVLVAKDTRENRAKYEREAMETFYLTGLPAEEQTEMVNLAREDFGAKTAFDDPDESALTVRAPADELTALNGTLQSLIEGHSEIQLDVVMYEVDRTKAQNIGAILPNETTLFNVYSEAASILQQNSSLVQQIIASGLAQPGQWEQILAILLASGQVSNPLLSGGFGVFGGGLTMTGVTYSGGSANLQLNSSDVHSVDEMQLRVQDLEEGTVKVGERYPIMTSNYSSLAGSALSIAGISNPGLSSTLQNLGVNLSALQAQASEPVPQVQYQDLGLTLVVTPHVLGAQGLSLKFDLKLTSLAGSSYNQVPVLDQREYQAITSLNLGESAVLLTALNRQQSVAVTGIPGLSSLPGFSDLSNSNSNFDYSELAIVITPHIVRLTHQESAERMYIVPQAPAQ